MTLFRLLLGLCVLAPAELPARAKAQAAHQDQEPPLALQTEVRGPHPSVPAGQVSPEWKKIFDKKVKNNSNNRTPSPGPLPPPISPTRTPSPLALPLAGHQPGSSNATQTFSPGR